MSNNDMIAKGLYEHPGVSGYLSLKQYIFAEREGKRCLLLRFVNDADFRINSAEFYLVQLDSYGKRIGRLKVRYEDIDVPPMRTYAPEGGLVVDARCVDFYVQMISVVAGDYKYVFKNGQATACYDPRGYAERRPYAVIYGDRRVRARFSRGSMIYGLIALISVLTVAAACAFGALREQSRFAKFEHAASSEEHVEDAD